MLSSSRASHKDSDSIRQLVRPTSGLSLNLKASSKPPPIFPPSYDPLSPSFDPSAASPCNPFPSSSPFVRVVFNRPQVQSKLRLEDVKMDHAATLQVSSQHIQAASVLAHIPPPHSAPSMRRTKPCRFYLDPAGCKTGRWCNFKHPVGARPEDKSPKDLSLDASREAVARSRGRSQSVEEDTRWDNVPDIRDVDPDYGKQTDGDVHPKWRTQPCRNYLLGLCKYGDKCQFIHPPGLIPHHAAPTALPLPIPVERVPISVWGTHPLVAATESVPASPELTIKKTPAVLAYRTKSCKFFEKSGSCPHGDGCKFLHDHRKSTPVSSSPLSSSSSFSSTSLPTPATSWADDDREIDYARTPIFDSIEVDSHLPQKPKSPARSRPFISASPKEKKSGAIKEASGIHKPTWRVLGGGVKLASPVKAQCQATPSPTTTYSEVEDDDVEILTYQPSIAFSAGSTHTTPSPPASLPSSPEYFADGSSLTTDLSQYNFATPTSFSYDLLALPSPDFPLDISMASPDAWSMSTMEAAQRKPRKRVTGADLMQGILSDASSLSQSTPVNDARSPRSRGAPRPRLTISVPSKSAVPNSTYRHSPYPNPSGRNKKSVTAVQVPETVTETGDDVLDWGVDDEAQVIEEEWQGDIEEELYAVEEEPEEEDAEERMDMMLREEIRRPHSTPPTPGYHIGGYVLDIPTMPRLPAESP
ncbi:hypothetical protein M422DRAFT_42161 [Sphaerobolus stellatus SS14]|nr:hypothetical protein M422DRAFT_42161 [Sphaerobolus stellatus SS14]